MKKTIMFLSIVGVLFSGCSSQKSVSPDNKSYVSVKKTYFQGGALSSEFLMTDKSGQNGIMRKYGYDGKVTSNTDIKNGVKHGYETLYQNNGLLLKKTPYVNGFIQGTEYIYYAGGAVMVTTPYASGKKHGKAVAYNPNGTVNKTAIFNNGIRR